MNYQSNAILLDIFKAAFMRPKIKYLLSPSDHTCYVTSQYNIQLLINRGDKNTLLKIKTNSQGKLYHC